VLLTGSSKSVGVPKVKSAFATPAGRPTTNAKSEIAETLVVFIVFSFQSLSLLKQGTVNTFTLHTVCSFVHSSSFAEEPASRSRWSYSYKHEKKSDRTILLHIFSRICKIYLKSLILRG
jgi:hypothetical protein